jgi:DinB superfamily
VSSAEDLVARLRAVSAALIATVEPIEPAEWSRVPAPGVWSPGKEAEHVAEGNAYHQWIVRMTLRHRVSTQRPAIERAQLTACQSLPETVDLLRQRTRESIALIEGLAEDQLELATRPPRPRTQTLAEMIERVLIGHIEAHRLAIEAKLREQSRQN